MLFRSPPSTGSSRTSCCPVPVSSPAPSGRAWPRSCGTWGPGTASYTISYSYNFGSRTATGNVSITTGAGWGTTGTGSVSLIASPFTSGSGEVKLGETINVPTGPLGALRIDYQFKNSNNIIFKTLDHRVQYNQGGTYVPSTNSFTGGSTASGSGATTRP